MHVARIVERKLQCAEFDSISVLGEHIAVFTDQTTLLFAADSSHSGPALELPYVPAAIGERSGRVFAVSGDELLIYEVDGCDFDAQDPEEEGVMQAEPGYSCALPGDLSPTLQLYVSDEAAFLIAGARLLTISLSPLRVASDVAMRCRIAFDEADGERFICEDGGLYDASGRLLGSTGFLRARQLLGDYVLSQSRVGVVQANFSVFSVPLAALFDCQCECELHAAAMFQAVMDDRKEDILFVQVVAYDAGCEPALRAAFFRGSALSCQARLDYSQEAEKLISAAGSTFVFQKSAQKLEISRICITSHADANPLLRLPLVFAPGSFELIFEGPSGHQLDGRCEAPENRSARQAKSAQQTHQAKQPHPVQQSGQKNQKIMLRLPERCILNPRHPILLRAAAVAAKKAQKAADDAKRIMFHPPKSNIDKSLPFGERRKLERARVCGAREHPQPCLQDSAQAPDSWAGAPAFKCQLPHAATSLHVSCAGCAVLTSAREAVHFSVRAGELRWACTEQFEKQPECFALHCGGRLSLASFDDNIQRIAQVSRIDNSVARVVAV